jgi:hypothetical protein
MVWQTVNKEMHRKFMPISIDIDIIKVQKLLETLVGNLTALKRLRQAKRESKRSFLELSLR